MKSVKTTSKRILSLFLAIMMIFSVIACVASTASALDYPILTAEEFRKTTTVGDTVDINYTYVPAYKNEKFYCGIYNESGSKVAEAEDSFYHSTQEFIDYTFTWDTAGYEPGEYKIVVTKEYYTYGSWYTAPYETTCYVNLTASIDGAEITGVENKTYTGKSITQNLKLTYNEKTLVEGTDYTVSYSNNKSVGVASITIIGTGDYEGTKTVNFNISPKKPGGISSVSSTKAVKLSWKKVTGATGYIIYQYNSATKKYVKIGTTKKLSFKATELKAGTKYAFKIKAYTTLSDGTKLYSDATTYKVATKPGKTAVALSSANSKMVVKWKKVTGATGYQIQYSTKSDFSSKKTVNVSKESSVKKTIKSLTAGKTYYVRVRAYKVYNGETLYGSYSAVKTVKIKK